MLTKAYNENALTINDKQQKYTVQFLAPQKTIELHLYA